MAALFVEVHKGYKRGAHNVVGFVDQGLLEVLLQGLNVDVVDDLGEDSQGVGFGHLVVVLPDVFGQLGDHDEDFTFARF